ncbi:MAG: transposase [Bacteroidota bacterium]
MSYESDLTDSDWELIEGIVYVGASTKIDRRELINAVFYIVKTGCQWRQ